MRRLLLLTVAGLLAGTAATATAGPDLCPSPSTCVEIRDDGTYVWTEPVKADIGPGRACAGLFSLPWACVSPQ